MKTEDDGENNKALHICLVLYESKFQSLQWTHIHNIDTLFNITFFFNPTYHFIYT